MTGTTKFFIPLVYALLAPCAFATGITFTCGPNTATFNAYATNDPNNDGYSGSLCSSIQSVVGGAYAGLFTNANANIYITFNSSDTTLLGGSSSGDDNYVSYSTYRTALAAAAASSGNAIQASAAASLPSSLSTVFPTGSYVDLTSALVSALGISNLAVNGGIGKEGVTSSLTTCVIGTNGCYNGYIELGTPANVLSSFGQGYYYGTGTQQSNQYDIYSIIEHEVDEVLGTASCIDTTGGSLANGCSFSGKAGVAPVDLFRYTASGTVAAYPTANPAYFSYNGGVTPLVYYNYQANGEDYADFNSSSPGTSYYCQYVQDAEGCPGQALSITSDGGAEVTILDAVGFTETAPEPATVGLAAVGLALLLRRQSLRAKL